MKIIELKANEIHFFYTPVEEIQDPLLLNHYRSIITAKEAAKAEKFIFAKDKHNSLVTRALLRFALSSSTNTAAENFEFTENSYGKPALIPDPIHPPIRFNLSHSSGITACALTLNNEIGIDIENYTRDVDPGLADRFFTKSESAYLQQCSAENKQQVFFDFWTLKESYSKARGKGLSIGLDTFGFEIEPSVRIYFNKVVDETPDDWIFFRFSPVENFKAAIAVHSSLHTDDFKLHIYKCIPFVHIELRDSLKSTATRPSTIRSSP